MNCNCENCGANLEYLPGSTSLECHYCGHKMEFGMDEPSVQAHQELDLDAYLNQLEDAKDSPEQAYISCNSCGAKTQLEDSKVAGDCPFCGSPLVLKDAHNERLIKPAGLLPFGFDQDHAQVNAHQWVKKRWFAPNDFKKMLDQKQRFRGIYLPFWTYDCSTYSQYVGQRGRHYYVTVSSSKGGSKRVRRTRWSMRAGQVDCYFDDLLIPATRSLPRKKLEALEPWDLAELQDYQDDYLLGFTAEAYQVGLKAGYQDAKGKMEGRIRDRVQHDIGGDEQRILSLNTRYEDATFKHILLPIWSAPYRYKGKLYQMLVNARTGEVQGERPWSWLKLGVLALSIFGFIAMGIYFYGNSAV